MPDSYIEACCKSLGFGKICKLPPKHEGPCCDSDYADDLCAKSVGAGMICPLPSGHLGPHQRPDDPSWQSKTIAGEPGKITLRDTNAERHFWEMAFCAALSEPENPASDISATEACGRRADRALEVWRNKWAK